MIIAFTRKSIILLFFAGVLLLIFGIMFLSTGETILNKVTTTKINSSYTLQENEYTYLRDDFSKAFSFVIIIIGLFCLFYSSILMLKGGLNG